MKGLTDRQKEVLQFIVDYTETNMCPPTIRETANNFGISLRAIQDHFLALEKKGYLTKTEKQSRSIRVINADVFCNAPQKVPVLKTDTKSNPVFCKENYEGNITISLPFAKSDATYFAIYVHDKSMINVGIDDGDIAVVQQQNFAQDGDIIVVAINNLLTLKRFFQEAARVRLQSENSDFNTIYASDVKILGKLSYIIRKY